MKHTIKVLLMILIVSFLIVACDEPIVDDHDPVIAGAIDKEIPRGTAFVPLEGITATDAEDGDLTEDIIYSGNVNPNVVGTYEANYTVTDSDGNTTTVQITITVVLVDTEAPLISGAGDLTVIVGDPDFDEMAGVSANDTVDGDVTADIAFEGDYDIWTPGEYTLSYAVEDAAGNLAERDRILTVSIGTFAFADDDVITNGAFETADGWVLEGADSAVTDGVLTATMTGAATLQQLGISGGTINLDIAPFGLAKLVFTAKADQERDVTITLDGTTTSSDAITLTETFAEYVKYFRMDAVLEDSTLTFALGSAGVIDVQSVQLIMAQSADIEAPVLNVPQTEVFVPINDMDALYQLVLKNVTAMDDIDGNITASVDLDLEGINTDQVATVQVPITVSDSAGNETRIMRTVHFRLAFDTNVITDPVFDNDLDAAQWGLSGGSEDVTLYNQDGVMVVDIVNPGGWDSATSPYLKGVTTNDLQAGNTFMFQFDIKADVARQMRMRAGLELWSDPWIEDFNGGAVKNLQYQVTDEWTTIYYVFNVDAQTSSAGSNVVKFEIKLGTITWGSEEKNNKVYIDNAQFYLLSDVDNEPVITDAVGVPYTFAVGAALPDFTTYITVADLEDGDIVVTPEMIDASAVDMNVAGSYDVIFTVTDSGMNEVTHTISITVLDEQDTTPPVLTLNDTLPTTFDQFEEVTIDFTAYFTALDDVDGEIVITNAMIALGAFSLDNAGEYTITWTVSDSSQNVSEESLVFVVNDKQGPAILGTGDITMNLGDTFDPLEGVTIVDNIDGPIIITMDHVLGTDLFLNTENVAVEVGEFIVTYSAVDVAGNTSEVTMTVTVLNLEFDETKTTDLLALQLPVQNDGGSIESVGSYNPDGSLSVTYNGVKGWYGSYSKITYSDVTLLENRVYKLVIEAQAQSARDVLVRFVGADNVALEAFANRLAVPLSTDMAVFELIFSLDQTGPYNIQLQFGWEGNLNNVSEANVMTFNQFKLIPEKVIEFDMDNAIDLLALETPVGNDDGGNIESAGVYNPDGSLTVTYNGVKGWYASYSKMTFYQSLTEGKIYKLVIEAKAETARDILVRFVDSGGTAVEGFDGRLVVPLGTEFNTFELVFTAPASDTYNLQIQFGWESFLTNASNANVIDITTFMIVPELVETIPEDLVFMLDDFEGYADQAAFELVYTHRVPNAGANHNDSHLQWGDFGSEGSKGAQLMIGEHAVTGWDLLRTKNNFDNTGLTNEYIYFSFWFQSDDVTSIYVWLYWSGSQNSVTVDVSAFAATGGYVTIPLSSWGKTATEITQFAIGYNLVNTTTQATVWIDNIMFKN
ncbi:MAG: DUF5011 domain-containing protein [Acholeplasmataceae bacterium]|nr:DUF5011 domain-containing protein [Acholeplasmataceae bacterium]